MTTTVPIPAPANTTSMVVIKQRWKLVRSILLNHFISDISSCTSWGKAPLVGFVELKISNDFSVVFDYEDIK
jgi:hypothetical protein